MSVNCIGGASLFSVYMRIRVANELQPGADRLGKKDRRRVTAALTHRTIARLVTHPQEASQTAFHDIQKIFCRCCSSVARASSKLNEQRKGETDDARDITLANSAASMEHARPGRV
jgi:histone H3/H4